MDTQVAQYCFVNHGWPPSKYAALPLRVRLLITEWALAEIKSRDRK